jgi:mRNA-degrading endonuclease RelE of RelBE toxin-antitoxin system
MVFAIKITDSALKDLQSLKKNEQVTVLDSISRQLVSEPLVQTRNRLPLRPNDLAQWELRVGHLRVFSDADGENEVVLVKAVGWKEHNQLFLRGREHKP